MAKNIQIWEFNNIIFRMNYVSICQEQYVHLIEISMFKFVLVCHKPVLVCHESVIVCHKPVIFWTDSKD